MKFNSAFIFLFPALIFVQSCSKDAFETGPSVNDRFHIKNGDYPIPVLVRGNTSSGKIILFIQGGPGSNTLDFAEIDYPGWQNSLEKKYAVAYYDQRGTGNRQGNFDQETISAGTYLSDLHEVARFLRSAYDAEIFMLGYSFGGHLMLRYMLEYKDKAVPAGFISAHGPASTDYDSIRWKFRRDFLFNTANSEIAKGENTEKWNEVLEWLDVHPEIKEKNEMNQWNSYVEELVYARYPEKSPGFTNYVEALFFSSYNPVQAYMNGNVIDGISGLLFQDMKEFKLIERLGGIDRKILIITGRYDDVCTPEEAGYIYNSVNSQDKQIVVIDNAGHESFNHQPEIFQNLITDFVK